MQDMPKGELKEDRNLPKDKCLLDLDCVNTDYESRATKYFWFCCPSDQKAMGSNTRTANGTTEVSLSNVPYTHIAPPVLCWWQHTISLGEWVNTENEFHTAHTVRYGEVTHDYKEPFYFTY